MCLRARLENRAVCKTVVLSSILSEDSISIINR
jgi:hypothetical protein